eukprot:6175009-Pleurochrysis_carterae.AAC.1
MSSWSITQLVLGQVWDWVDKLAGSDVCHAIQGSAYYYCVLVLAPGWPIKVWSSSSVSVLKVNLNALHQTLMAAGVARSGTSFRVWTSTNRLCLSWGPTPGETYRLAFRLQIATWVGRSNKLHAARGGGRRHSAPEDYEHSGRAPQGGRQRRQSSTIG